jgi:hypothetical protein
LAVEAIETCFVPIGIQNNAEGAAAAALERFGEPAWNNPVVRFLDGDGRDLLPRRDGVYEIGRIVERMHGALEAAGKEPPAWLALPRDEALTAGAPRVVAAMHCFWEGEAELGALPGVLSTAAGFVGEREVVELRYDGARLPFARLLSELQRLECAEHLWVERKPELDLASAALGERAELAFAEVRPAPAADQKHALALSPLARLPLTPLQAQKVNSALAAGESPARWLAPWQAALAERLLAAPAAALGSLGELAPPGELGAWPAYRAELERRLDAASAVR